MIGVCINSGLCNRLFQIAYGYSLAKQHGLQFRLETWNSINRHSTQSYDWLLQRIMQLPNYYNTQPTYSMLVQEGYNDFTTYVDRYSTSMQTNNVLLYGYFQNEKYFKEYRTDILELLKEPKFINDKLQNQYASLLPLLNDTYFLHIRLGDYVNHDKHWIVLEDYYLKALREIPHTAPVLVFTNDWAELPNLYPKLYSYLQTINHIAVQDPDEVTCLYLMARCKKGGICGNSTFGWWGAWLNTNETKKVYFPSRWVTGEEFICDIYPEGSIKI
jgi:hypothetical protein